MAESTFSSSHQVLRDTSSGYSREVNMSRRTLLGSVQETSSSARLSTHYCKARTLTYNKLSRTCQQTKMALMEMMMRRWRMWKARTLIRNAIMEAVVAQDLELLAVIFERKATKLGKVVQTVGERRYCTQIVLASSRRGSC